MAFSDKEPQGFLTKGFEEKVMFRHQSQFSVYGRFYQGKSLRKLCRFSTI